MKKEERRIFNQWMRKYPFLWAINQSRWDLVKIYADRVGQFGFNSLLMGRSVGHEMWVYYEAGTGPVMYKLPIDFTDSYKGIKSALNMIQLNFMDSLVYVIFVDLTSICICKEPAAGWSDTFKKFLAGMDDRKRSMTVSLPL